MLTMVLFSCQKLTPTNEEEMLLEANANKGKFSNVVFTENMDPVCLMSLEHGISDTVKTGKTTLGFCSKGCKIEYLKNPKQYKHKFLKR